MTQNIVTRFAPSPTGFMHLGNVRTALFNWLFARNTGGKFLLRIEDTDRERSTEEAVQVIFDSLNWLGLDWDGEATFQFARKDRHADVAQQLIDAGQAYYCYCTPEELDAMRTEQKDKGLPQKYDGRWRDRAPSEAPEGIPPVVRIKAPQTGEMTIQDIVQGDVTVPAEQLDDFILLRADGTPTYMLSVVVDDHDMGITHIIRGDDHLNNAFRQSVIYHAMGWDVPQFAHAPLIHGQDGGKLSKRHGAVGLGTYRDMGYLPEAMSNYLLRLGWGHGDTEVISMEAAKKIFALEDIGRSPARMDFAKLAHVNAHYLRECDDDSLMTLVTPHIEKALGQAADDTGLARFKAGLEELKERAETLDELAHAGLFYVRKRPLLPDADAGSLLDAPTRALLTELRSKLDTLPDFKKDAIQSTVKDFAKQKDLKMGKVGMPLRAALTGTTSSPSIFSVAEILGRDETLARLDDVA